MAEKKEDNLETMEFNLPQNIKDRRIANEMKESYLDYSMSVIVGRALPDVRDGLKPVHRRVLYGMSELGNHYNKPYKKSARVVGDVLGKYHPHGDSAVYDTIVRMVQDFSLRYPLVDGQGNFGSLDGDNAAAMRYTEVRMAKISTEVLGDLDKQTVDFAPNFDGSLKEPLVLPSKLPNLLVNGSSGIAVGMATNMPPHNLREVCDAVLHLIDNPECELNDLMTFIKGPDFPTGAVISGKSGIYSAYSTGKGGVKVKARAEFVEKNGRQRIIVNEIPYMVNKARLIEQIASLVNHKKIEGISDLRDESDRDGVRVVIELKKGADPNIVLNQLYSRTPMQTTFGINNVALVNGQPKLLTLRELLDAYISHRREVVTRRASFELAQAEARAHIVEGLRVALENIDPIVKGVKAASNTEEALQFLMADFSLSEKQAQAILDMKLQKLTGLEREKLDKEHEDLRKKIQELSELLADVKKVLAVVKAETVDLRDAYGDNRRTEIVDAEDDFDMEDLIPDEQAVLTITKNGYIKRMPLSEYETQKRGGKGITGVRAKEEDIATELLVARTHDYLLFFTDKGRVHWLKVYRVPVAGRYAAGKAIVNLLELGEEKMRAVIKVREFEEDKFLIMATRNGLVKRTQLSAYSHPRRGGIIAVTLKDGDDLIDVKLTDGSKDIVLGSRDGYAIRFAEKEARPIGRTGMGVIGMRLRKGDQVVGMAICELGETLLTVCENGYGKRTPLEDYRRQSRGGMGVINIKTTERNGKVVAVRAVGDEHELMMVNSSGVIIRIPAKSISVIGRSTQGVRLMRLKEGERVAAVARVMEEAEDEEEGLESVDNKNPEAKTTS